MIAFLDFFYVVTEESKSMMDMDAPLYHIQPPSAPSSCSQAVRPRLSHDCPKQPITMSGAHAPPQPWKDVKDAESFPVVLHANSFLAQYVRRHIKQCQRNEKKRRRKTMGRPTPAKRNNEETNRLGESDPEPETAEDPTKSLSCVLKKIND